MAHEDLEARAEAGDVEAQCAAAFLYEIGLDRPLDYHKAAYFWQMAARSGNLVAQDKIKLLIEQGRIPAPDAHILPADVRHKWEKTPWDHNPRSLAVKVLLAEDEQELLTMMTDLLQSVGLHVITATNGEEAMQKVIGHPDVKLIITDLKMPKLNGLQFIRTLRRMRLAERAKVVVLSAYSQPNLIAEGKKLNIESWLVKPIQPELLIDAVMKLVDRRPHIA
ncbi:MAG: response regulator [Oligoflexus sp.]|jgi:two-component system chemotaxis response regulator CheY